MISPAAKGERFLAASGDVIKLIDVAMILKKRLGPVARRVPTRELPDWLVRLLARFMPDLRLIALELGNVRNLTNAKAKRILNWTPRSNEDCIVATAESLQRHGLLKT
jgi:nucleoside-diphosphate-sugar epimerase